LTAVLAAAIPGTDMSATITPQTATNRNRPD
jgi:hypothetical protein